MGHRTAFCGDVEAPPIGGHRGHVVGRKLVKPMGVVHDESTRAVEEAPSTVARGRDEPSPSCASKTLPSVAF